MLISVIIPVYNAEKTLPAALQSVAGQHFKEGLEIILTDDGSTDKSAEVAHEFLNKSAIPWQFTAQRNLGVSKARNEAMKKAKGQYLAFLDADDQWMPDKLEKQLAVIKEKNLNFLAAKRSNQNILFPYKVEKDNLAKITFGKLLIRNEIHPSTVIISRQALENTGFFDENQRYAEDVNYWMRISEKNEMFILNEPLVIAGGGKRTFGISGLSANLKMMDRGFRKNLRDMYKAQRISRAELIIYDIFYRFKYLILNLRTKL